MEHLNKLVKDKQTGYTGIAYAYEVTAYGLPRYHVQAKMTDKEEVPNGYSFDAVDIEVIDNVPYSQPTPTSPNYKVFNFGDEVEDTLTGFKGKIATKLYYGNGCVRYSVAEKYHNKEESSLSPAIFADGRLKLIKAVKTIDPPVRVGGPMERGASR